MTVLQVLGCCSSKFGAVEKFMLQLCRTDNNNKYILLYDEMPDSELFQNEVIKAGGIIEVLDGRGSKLFSNSLRFYKLLRKYNPDFVHFHFSNQYCVWGMTAKIFGVKFLYKTIHGCVYRKGRQVQNLHQLGIKQRLLTLDGLIFRMMDKIICVSEYVANQMGKIYGGKYVFNYAYLGTHSPIFISDSQKQVLRSELNISESDVVITSIMFASKMKGGDILLESFAKLDSYDNIKLIFIGLDVEHQVTHKLMRLADELGISTSIRWIGITDNVQQYLNITDVYVQPSRTEALSLSAVEALSYSIPVVGSNVGGLPEVSLILFSNEDTDDLSKQLRLLITDKELRDKLGKEGFGIWSKKMSIDKGVEYYKSLYEMP